MKWDSVNIAACPSIAVFLTKVIDQNLARNPNLSIRWLGRKLEWPPSFINDVLAGRKGMTLQRALELARFLELDIFDTEHLVLLTLTDANDGLIKQHFKSELEARFTVKKEEEVDSLGALESVEALLIFGLLGWAQVRLANIDIKNSLYTLVDITLDEIEQIVKALEGDQLITIHADHSVTLDRSRFDVVLSRMGEKERVNLALQMLNNLANYVRDPKRQSPGPFHFRIQTFPLKYVEQVEKRLAQMSSWISQLDVNEKRPDDSELPKQLYQFFFFFAPLVNKDVLIPAARQLESKGKAF